MITSTYMKDMNSTAILNLRNMTWSITAEPPLRTRSPVITAKNNKENCHFDTELVLIECYDNRSSKFYFVGAHSYLNNKPVRNIMTIDAVVRRWSTIGILLRGSLVVSCQVSRNI